MVYAKSLNFFFLLHFTLGGSVARWPGGEDDSGLCVYKILKVLPVFFLGGLW